MFKKMFHRKKKGRIDRKKVEVHVDAVEPFVNEKCSGITIYWYGSPGFGQYTLYRHNEEGAKWRGDSEYMDSNDDKWFIDLLLKDFVSQLEVD